LSDPLVAVGFARAADGLQTIAESAALLIVTCGDVGGPGYPITRHPTYVRADRIGIGLFVPN
jgi:hypothetical protein